MYFSHVYDLMILPTLHWGDGVPVAFLLILLAHPFVEKVIAVLGSRVGLDRLVRVASPAPRRRPAPRRAHRAHARFSGIAR